MYKISIIIILTIFIFSCQQKEEANDTTTNDVTTNAEPPQPIPTLQVENFPVTAIEDSITKIKTTDTPEKWTIVAGNRVGKITKNTTLDQIKSIYGVKIDDLDTVQSGNKKAIAITFFKNLPNQFQVYWMANNNYQNPVMVKLSNRNSQWQTVNGLKIGASLETVIAANGKDFYFVGFDDTVNDGRTSGKVRSWNNGRLSNNLGIAFQYDSKADAFDSFKSFEVLKPFPTNYPDVKKLGLTIREISCTFR